MSREGFSQNGYPKRITDSTYEIHKNQVKKLNKMYLDFSECREVVSLLQEGLDTCRLGLELADKTNSSLQNIITIQESSIAERDTVISKAVIMTEKQNSKIKRLTNSIIVWRTSAIVSIIFIGVLIVL